MWLGVWDFSVRNLGSKICLALRVQDLGHYYGRMKVTGLLICRVGVTNSLSLCLIPTPPLHP